MPVQIRETLSFSALDSYRQCGERFRLERGYGLKGHTYYATLAGTVVHHLTELIDTGHALTAEEVVERFKEEFDQEIAKEGDREIRASGRKMKEVGPQGGPNKKDYDWWLIYGPQMVGNWIQWERDNEWDILEIDGKPAVEVPFEVTIGDVPVRGYIDRVMKQRETGEIATVDLKSGKEPSWPFQLVTYREGLLQQYGVRATLGFFFLAAGSGKMTQPIDLNAWPPEYAASLYQQTWNGMLWGVFLPSFQFCRACPVQEYCYATGGHLAKDYPLDDTINIKSLNLHDDVLECDSPDDEN